MRENSPVAAATSGFFFSRNDCRWRKEKKFPHWRIKKLPSWTLITPLSLEVCNTERECVCVRAGVRVGVVCVCVCGREREREDYQMANGNSSQCGKFAEENASWGERGTEGEKERDGEGERESCIAVFICSSCIEWKHPMSLSPRRRSRRTPLPTKKGILNKLRLIQASNLLLASTSCSPINGLLFWTNWCCLIKRSYLASPIVPLNRFLLGSTCQEPNPHRLSFKQRVQRTSSPFLSLTHTHAPSHMHTQTHAHTHTPFSSYL